VRVTARSGPTHCARRAAEISLRVTFPQQVQVFWYPRGSIISASTFGYSATWCPEVSSGGGPFCSASEGWPIGSGNTEAGVKQFNKRVKGTEQFWSEDGVEAILCLRGLWLSQDERWVVYWKNWPAYLKTAASTVPHLPITRSTDADRRHAGDAVRPVEARTYAHPFGRVHLGKLSFSSTVCATHLFEVQRMSDHSHDEQGASSHSSHGHGEHAHGHGHEQHWGDYNAKAPPPSTLPPINAPALAVFGFALLAMLGAITLYSLKLAHAQPAAHGPADQH